MSKQLYTLEFPVRCSPSILYEFLSTPAGLGEWFAEKVDERDNIFYFGWNGAYEKAEVLESEGDKHIRFRFLIPLLFHKLRSIQNKKYYPFHPLFRRTIHPNLRG